MRNPNQAVSPFVRDWKNMKAQIKATSHPLELEHMKNLAFDLLQTAIRKEGKEP